MFQLSVELVLVLVVGKHFADILEASVAGGLADFGVGAQHLAEFGIDILEEEVVARHGDMVLVEVQVVAAFESLEEFGLAGILGRLAVSDRQVALFDVSLLHLDNHLIDGGDVVVGVMVGDFDGGLFDGGATHEDCCGDGKRCQDA